MICFWKGCCWFKSFLFPEHFTCYELEKNRQTTLFWDIEAKLEYWNLKSICLNVACPRDERLQHHILLPACNKNVHSDHLKHQHKHHHNNNHFSCWPSGNWMHGEACAAILCQGDALWGPWCLLLLSAEEHKQFMPRWP